VLCDEDVVSHETLGLPDDDRPDQRQARRVVVEQVGREGDRRVGETDQRLRVPLGAGNENAA
jgi:hypothetical protein